MFYKLAIAPLSSEAQLKLNGLEHVTHKRAALPRATLEIPLATHASLPGFYYHAERRVPLRSNKPQVASLATLPPQLPSATNEGAQTQHAGHPDTGPPGTGPRHPYMLNKRRDPIQRGTPENTKHYEKASPPLITIRGGIGLYILVNMYTTTG